MIVSGEKSKKDNMIINIALI